MTDRQWFFDLCFWALALVPLWLADLLYHSRRSRKEEPIEESPGIEGQAPGWRATSPQSGAFWIMVLSLLLVGCYPKVKVYGPVEPCVTPPAHVKAPPATKASLDSGQTVRRAQ